MKKLSSFFVLFCLVLSAWAQPVSEQEAANAAAIFFQSKGKTNGQCEKIVKDVDGSPLLYIFNAENGFVVLSADKRVNPVLAYTEQQRYNEADIVAPAKMWLDHYAQQISDLRKESVKSSSMHPQWLALADHQPIFRTNAEIAPLMQSHWGQGMFYNYYCPRDFDGENGRVVTGCVATAMAQIIYYFRFPETGVGSYSYVDEHYGEQSANYGETTYDFEAMCDEPTAINPAICTLMHHCGVGVDMVYGPDGSGMYNHSAARVLRNFFKFSPETEYLFRDSTDLDWDSVIVSHLTRNIPMYYAGWSTPNINGHGFICDGFQQIDSAYYYHFNFGWDGSSDAYFYTNALNMAGTHFNLAQELIVNAYPDTANYSYPSATPLVGSRTLTTPQGSFTDGTLASADYRHNMNFTWKIVPVLDNLTDINLDVDYAVAAGDTLYIVPPVNVNTPAIIITADSGHQVISWPVDSVEVRFVTDGESAREGFRLNYTTTRTEFCQSSQNFTSANGTIVDGSQENPYNNFTSCKYKIVLPSYSAISLHFREFDLEDQHDYLYVFDNTITADHLLASFTGVLPDTTMVFNKKRLTLVFESDEQTTGQGFEIDYSAGYVGVDDYASDAISVYPNPVSDLLVVNSDSPMNGIEIYDMQGRVVMSATPTDQACQLSVAELSSGVYSLRIITSKNVVVRKFVKK